MDHFEQRQPALGGGGYATKQRPPLSAPSLWSAVQQLLGLMQQILGTFSAFTPAFDGNVQRFHLTADKPGTRNAWFIGHSNGHMLWAVFGYWKILSTHHWSSKQPTSPAEALWMRQEISQRMQQAQAEQLLRQKQTVKTARIRWMSAGPALACHPYLQAKHIQPHIARQMGPYLLIPIVSAGRLVNLQMILADGTKRFLKSGQIKGCYSPIGTLNSGQALYICEGFATGATLHEQTGHPVACAMNAGNLLPAALQLRQKYPEVELIIAGDDDRKTKGNPGLTMANKAALATAAQMVMPNWPEGCPDTLTDFNDLVNWEHHHGM